MKSSMIKVLVVDSVYEGGRMFVGAVSAIYLLSLGYSASTIAILKMVQAIVVLMGEFPSGVVGDYFGRKKNLVASVVLASIGFICFLNASHIAILVLGEALLALSLCLWSGTYEAWALDVAKVRESEVKEFFHTNSSLNQTTVLIAGFLGGLWAGQAGLYHYAYLAALVSMVLLTLFLLMAPSGDMEAGCLRSLEEERGMGGLIKEARSSISVVMSSKTLTLALAFSAVMQFSVQPMLHYWQPIVSNAVGEGGNVLGTFFAIFCAGSALMSWVFRKSKYENVSALLVLWLGLLIIVGLVYSETMIVIAMIGSQISYFFLKSLLNSRVATLAPAAQRASVLSFTSLISRAGMLMSLLVMSLILEVSGGLMQGVRSLYVVMPVISVFGLLFAMSLGRYRVKGRIKTCN